MALNTGPDAWGNTKYQTLLGTQKAETQQLQDSGTDFTSGAYNVNKVQQTNGQYAYDQNAVNNPVSFNSDGTLTDASRAGVEARRQEYSNAINKSNSGQLGTSATNITAAQNAQDNALSASDTAKRQTVAAANANYAGQGTTGVNAYKDANGNAQIQAPTLLGTANALNDPNSASSLAYQYGGQLGGAASVANGLYQLGNTANGRSAIQADMTQSNQALGSQNDALGMYQQAALGNGPSAAQSQFNTNLGQSMNASMALGNSSRGGSLGLAQGRLAALGYNANTLAGATSQAATLRAQEQQAGLAGYAGLGTNIRSQDVTAAQDNATNALGSQNSNDAASEAYQNLANTVNTTQLGAQQNRVAQQAAVEGASSANALGQNTLQAQEQENSSNNTSGWVKAGVTAAAAPVVPVIMALGGKSTSTPQPQAGDGGAGDGGDSPNTVLGSPGSTVVGAGDGVTTGSVAPEASSQILGVSTANNPLYQSQQQQLAQRGQSRLQQLGIG